jgi:hypothetical protein
LAENHPLYPNAPATKPDDFVDKVSFLKSESVGVHTLNILDLLRMDEVKED